MPLTSVFEKLGKAIFESPFSAARISEEVPELAEIRLIALDTIKNKSHRVSGKNVFPYNRIRIHLSGVPEKQAQAFRSEFLNRYFDQELKGGLLRSQYRFPEDLRVEIETTPDLPGPKGQWVHVETESIPRPEIPSLEGMEAVLHVLQGIANEPEVRLDKIRTNIGRTADVFKSAGPSRRNDITFSADTEINRSVSREHAHIMRDKTAGGYRIFNDRWYKVGNDTEANCGLWVVREGLSQPIHRNTRGVALQNGDEIHLGLAIIQFTIEPSRA